MRWSMKVGGNYKVYIQCDTTAGRRNLLYRPYDYNSLGTGTNVTFGLGSDTKDGQWHTFVRDLQADLSEAQPGVEILKVNHFLIRGSGSVDDKTLTARVAEVIDFRLGAIVRDLRLQKLPASHHDDGFYQRLAVYGHMGRTDLNVPWEQTDKAKALK